MTASEILSLLEAADPARSAEEPRLDSQRARALKDRILAAEPRARARRRLGLAIAAAALAVTAIGLPRALESAPLEVDPAAAAVLEQAASAAARATPAPARRYAYTKMRTIESVTDTDDPPFTALVPAVQETWLAADGSGRVRALRGRAFFPSDRDRRRWLAHGSPPVGLPAGSVSIIRLRPARGDAAALARRDPASLDARELDRLLSSPAVLPTEVDALERLVRAYARTKDPPVESAMFNELEELLTTPYSSRRVRAAAYRVLARMSGIALHGRLRDPAGRAATAIDVRAGYSGAVRYRIFVDPATGAVLASETLLARPNDEIAGKPGAVVGETVYLRSGWTGRIGEH
jgi:hypothetical protein